MNSDNAMSRLKNVCITNNFIRRRNAFFRVHGDGVLQVVQVKKERYCSVHEISLGLFSMYGELQAEWFTPGGCIPNYLVVGFIGLTSAEHWEKVDHEPADVPIIRDSRGVYVKKIVTLDQQLQIFQNKAMPFLNGITTQGQMAQALCRLDELQCSQIRWLDSLKFEPFLHSGDDQSAQRVIQEIIDHNNRGYEEKRGYMSPQEYQKYRENWKKWDIGLRDKLNLVQDGNTASIQEYLSTNHTRNNEFFTSLVLKR